MAKNKWRFTLKMPKKFDFWLQFSSLILILFGSIMIISTSVGSTSVNNPYVVVTVAIKQVIFIIISYVMMTFLANNFTMVRARKLAKPLGVLLMGACLSTLAFIAVNGSRAWIRLGPITLQPAEFVKVYMVVMIAVYVEIAGRRNFDWFTIVKVPLFFFIAFIGIVILQSDLGTMVIIGLLTLISFLIPSHKNLRKIQRIAKVLFAGACLLFVFLMSDPGLKIVNEVFKGSHISTRFNNAANPFVDRYASGYQPIQGLVGIASSNFFGNGIGSSRQKFGYLTQADNDYILAVVIEETGIFGLLIIVVGYIIIIQRLLYYALRTKSEGYKIILIGTAMYIFLHFLLNVGGVGCLIPLTGVPLLFISSGGSSLMSIMSALGISQAVISRIRRQGA